MRDFIFNDEEKNDIHHKYKIDCKTKNGFVSFENDVYKIHLIPIIGSVILVLSLLLGIFFQHCFLIPAVFSFIIFSCLCLTED